MTGTNYQKLLNVITPELDEIYVAIRDIQIAYQVETTRGKSLDNIGVMLDFKRIVTESDESYRERLRNIIYINTIAGTRSAIKKLLSNFLRIPETYVIIQESEPNYITVWLPLEYEFKDKDIQDMVRRSIAAGIYVSFRYASNYWDVSEWDTDNAVWC